MKKILFVLKMLLVMSLAAGLLISSGCNKHYDPETFRVYYVNGNWTDLEPMEYELKAAETYQQIDELLYQLSSNTGRVDYVSPIQEGIMITDYELQGEYLLLYFDSSYESMDNVREVLCRAAVVKTLVQLDGVKGVGFFVGEEPLLDSEGEKVGMMLADSFIDNPGEDMQNIQETELTLYFASADGKSLVKEVQNVHYNSNVSVEKLIIERLLKSPTSENAQGAIPTGTQLINISVMDGICVVNFDNTFLTQNYDISEEIVIYSIVNSLTELSNVQTVQISVNGETNRVYRDKMSLSEQYQRNLDYVIDETVVKSVEVMKDDNGAETKGGVLNNITEQK